MSHVRKYRHMGALAHSTAAAFACFAALGALACSSAGSAAGTGGNSATVGGTPGAGGAVGTGSGGQITAVGGSTVVAQGGSSVVTTQGGNSPQGGAASSQGGSVALAGSAGQGGAAVHTRDHCVEGYEPDPSDATGMDGAVEYTKSNQIDLTVQPNVLSWMQAHVWEEAHFQWHNIRRCVGGLMAATADPAGGGINPCLTNPELIPAAQEGHGAEDGLEFLAQHRHMIQSMKQLFPNHIEQFTGWDHFPQKASDVPKEWQADWTAWASTMATALAAADDPASHMKDKGFETEGDFGQWIQTTSGIHGALHFKWVRTNNSDHGLGNQFTNVDNYMFWKMHGWIDKVWDRYRAVSGKTPNDQDIKDAVALQCHQMDQLALLVKPSLATDCTAAPVQTGVFVDTIRPIFESSTNKCTGCHGRSGANGNLTLGGSDCVKSSDIVAALVNQPSAEGGQFKLVVPGDPDHSWLYLKATGKAATAGCMPVTGGAGCNTESMPAGANAVTLNQTQQDALRSWIMNGAVAPQ
jgi:hypothetical protein